MNIESFSSLNKVGDFPELDQSIVQFLKDQTCTTICCLGENHRPSCFSCFYAFDPVLGAFYFKTNPNSIHSKNFEAYPDVSGTVMPDKLNKLLIKGIQFEGLMVFGESNQLDRATALYYKKFPLARAISGKVFTLLIYRLKFTDNSKGFGHKKLWSRDQ